MKNQNTDDMYRPGDIADHCVKVIQTTVDAARLGIQTTPEGLPVGCSKCGTTPIRD